MSRKRERSPLEALGRPPTTQVLVSCHLAIFGHQSPHTTVAVAMENGSTKGIGHVEPCGRIFLKSLNPNRGEGFERRPSRSLMGWRRVSAGRSRSSFFCFSSPCPSKPRPINRCNLIGRSVIDLNAGEARTCSSPCHPEAWQSSLGHVHPANWRWTNMTITSPLKPTGPPC